MRIASVLCVCVALSAGGCFKSTQARLSSLGDRAAAVEKRLMPASPAAQQMVAVAVTIAASKIPMVAHAQQVAAQAQQVADAVNAAPAADAQADAPAADAPESDADAAAPVADAQIAVAAPQHRQAVVAMPVVMTRTAAPHTVFVLHTATNRCEVHASLQECNATCGRMSRSGTSCSCVEQTGGC